MRFLDIYQVTQALNTVLTNQKQLLEMRRSWAKIDFESVRNQSALVCNCRHEDLVQLLEGEFVQVLDGLSKSQDPVRDVMAWADKCCERLMGGRGGGAEERTTMSSRSVLIRWGYVTSQVMRDLVREPFCQALADSRADHALRRTDYPERPCVRRIPDPQAVLGVSPRRRSLTRLCADPDLPRSPVTGSP